MFTQHAACNGAAAKLTRWAELLSRLRVIKTCRICNQVCVLKSCELVSLLVILQYYANIYRGTIPNTAQP